MPRVQPRHQHTARRRTHRGTRVVPSELHALCGKAINVRRLQLLLAIAAEITNPQIIRKNIDDIGTASGGGR